MSKFSKGYYLTGIILGVIGMFLFYNYGSPCATELSSIGVLIFLFVPMMFRFTIFIKMKQFFSSFLFLVLIIMIVFILHNLTLELEECSRCYNNANASEMVN